LLIKIASLTMFRTTYSTLRVRIFYLTHIGIYVINSLY